MRALQPYLSHFAHPEGLLLLAAFPLLWLAALELASDVRRRGGHRLGLVAFAGQARVLCPLTPDYDHFREALAILDPADPQLAPAPGEDGPTSGTRIGEALVQAVQLHEPRF